MKILFVTQNDPIYVRGFFEEFLRMSHNRLVIAGVVVAPPMGKRSMAALAAQMLNFYGPVDFVRLAFRYAMLRAGAFLPAAFRRGKACSIEQAVRDNGVQFRSVENLNSPEFVDWIRAQSIDLVVSVAAPQIFREPLIAAPRLGCINIHNSKLPKYRGMLPNFWQMFHGEKAVGTSIHRINAKLDDGAILAQIETPIVQGESLDQLIRRTKQGGARFMLETLLAMQGGTIREIPNPANEGSYFTFPTSADVRIFRQRGFRLL